MNITTKIWCALFCVACLLAMAFIMGTNYVLDPYDYFSDAPPTRDSADMLAIRNTKIHHVRQNPALYGSFIIGGSRAGVLDPDMVLKFTGIPCYNLFFSSGNMEDYERIINFLFTQSQTKHIILQLHGSEAINAKSQISRVYALESTLPAKIGYIQTALLADCTSPLLNHILKRNTDRVKKNGMANYLELAFSPTEWQDLRFIDQRFMDLFQKNYGNIFSDKAPSIFPDMEITLESLARIKRKCVANNIKLTVLLCPSSIAALSSTESPLYWDYLHNIAAITDFYNFNGYAPINFNPYNFIDTGHYRNEIGDKMLRVIFDQEPVADDGGVLLSKDNISAYLERRKARYFTLKKNYEESGSIPTGTMNDASFIPVKAD